MIDNSLSSRLKEETKKAHQELEKKVILKMKAIRSDADYADFLNSFYNYFHAIEQVITPYVTKDVLPDHADRRNSKYLKLDIEALASQVKLLPEITVPKIETLAQAMGAMYVLEGSIMCGPIIVNILKKYGITKGFSFFSGYGENTGKMWKNFISVLNTHVVSPIDQQVAIEAANQTFNNFQQVFKD